MQIQKTFQTIKKKLKDNQYALTSVVLQDFIITENYIIGFQITKGIWYKLRLYCALNPDAVNPIITEYVEQFLFLDNAIKKIQQIQENQK